jgi:hypothetical protein
MMAIYTRFGTEVKIIAGSEDAEKVRVRTEFGDEREMDWRTLKADEGIHEIVEALGAVEAQE